mmetsp:Transcript_31557/g.36446  ORF Transcript_31557/g.36446 Transcript_31557/m.36446 type:complete len:83 (+) Transcript_31557:1246-1494(+)
MHAMQPRSLLPTGTICYSLKRYSVDAHIPPLWHGITPHIGQKKHAELRKHDAGTALPLGQLRWQSKTSDDELVTSNIHCAMK